MTFQLGGFTEAVISVKDIKPWINLFCDGLGWQLSHQELLQPSLLAFWQLQAGAGSCEVLLNNPADKRGMLRLYQLNLEHQQAIRADTRSWDSGGIFDLNVRVHNCDAVAELLVAHQWSALSAPQQWQFGRSKVIECLLCGPDAVTVAAIERLQPALVDWHFEHVSRVFNASQVVADMSRALQFYRCLGFTEIVSHEGPLPNGAGQVLGMDEADASSQAVSLSVLHPQGQMDGSIELVAFPGRSSEDVSHRARLENLGVCALRFPVKNLAAFAAHLQRQGIALEAPGLVEIQLAPYGKVRMLAIHTPDRARLEFYDTTSVSR